MITRKQNVVSTTAIWPYTPEPSPPLGPTAVQLAVDDHFKMSEDLPRLRPTSVSSRREGLMSPTGRPTLDDVLNNRAASPYTLAAYTAFLSQQHCLETLEFVTEAKKYSVKYYEVLAQSAGMPFTTDMADVRELAEDWSRLLDIYVKPGAPREINLPAEERDDLVDICYEPRAPAPELLEPAMRRMYDLMSDSIFIPFCNSLKAFSPAALSAGTGFSSLDNVELSKHQHQQQHSSRRRRSPPNTSHSQQRSNLTSTQPSAVDRTSGTRLSMHISHSSAASEAGLSDESGSAYSPAAGERMERDMFVSPPNTPPQSAATISHSHSHGQATGPAMKSSKAENGGWKKLGKFFGGGGKKKPHER